MQQESIALLNRYFVQILALLHRMGVSLPRPFFSVYSLISPCVHINFRPIQRELPFCRGLRVRICLLQSTRIHVIACHRVREFYVSGPDCS